MKVFAFDLDGTLTQSKSPVDEQMKDLLCQLSLEHLICVISGGRWQQFKEQLIDHLADGTHKSRVHCFPTCGTTYYRFQDNDWKQIYNHPLSQAEKDEIIATIETAMAAVDYGEPKVYGDVIEDRDSQITFSALGQKAPLRFKETWDPGGHIRSQMVEIMRPLLSNFDVRFGGTTSIDVSRKGHDKRMAIENIKDNFGCSNDDIVFFGDRIHPRGNDYAVYQAGIECIPVLDHIDCIWKVKQYWKTLSQVGR